MYEIIKYTEDGILTLEQAALLKPDDLTDIQLLSKELQDTFEKKQVFRTETEMRVSVLNDISFPTPASKYWQCVREQAVFFDNLVMASFDYRKNEIKLKKLLKKQQSTDDELELEEIKIDIDECLYKRKLIQNQAKDRAREIKLWSKIKNELDDGSFDTKNVDSHQLKSYAQRYLLECAAVLESNADLSHPEAVNLLGQTMTMLKECENKGIIQDVLNIISPNLQEKLLPKLGYHKVKQ